MVKADAYGLGLGPVARTLRAAGARTWFVADLEEAAALRGVVPDAAHYVLGGYAVGAEAGFARPDDRPILNSADQVRRFAARDDASARGCAIQIDTGMTRLGVAIDELDALRPLLERLKVELVLSHLASADEVDETTSRRQLAAFGEARRWFPGIAASLANSAGTLRGGDYRYDLCRPGISLYGSNPLAGTANPMRPVVELDAELLQIHDVKGEARVGYAGTYAVAAGGRVGTAAIGYADGLLRCIGNRATALVAGTEVPLAGRVSMDLIGLDLTRVPTTAVRPGDRVKLVWGADGIDRLAAHAETIAYEVLVRLGSRVERRYVGGTG